VRHTADGRELCDVVPERRQLHAPDSDYVLTLDADSLLAPSYALRLVHLLEDPQNTNVAVAQTPYSSVLGAPTRTERVAGATTDLQYVIHQGFTAHGATYWVGANAVPRKRALEDIASDVVDERTGLTHTRYIQDRTVIEDTESSIDLVRRGWGLFNYPARLSYSATPADFGALVVQRRRWANGGLLILPKLLGVLVRRQIRDVGPLHAFMRVHYLVSIAAVNIGLVVLFLIPFPGWSANEWLPLTAVPYFLLYARDLRLVGYRRRDLVAVYELNLLLIRVNLGGVLNSPSGQREGKRVQAHTKSE
jgi:cellulose synthase/poly-beta-1,6-N-acetylglucosamine synthase-like glycosyltransferase